MLESGAAADLQAALAGGRVVLWPRGVSVVKPGESAVQHRGSLEREAVSAWGRVTTSAALASDALVQMLICAEGDLQYGHGLFPDPEVYDAVRAHCVATRVITIEGWARHTLPVSIAARVTLLRELGVRRVLLWEDADNLAALPAYFEACVVGEGSLAHAQALDAAWLWAGPAHELRRRFTRACAALRPGGHVIVTALSPWDIGLVELARACGLQLVRRYREREHTLVPGGLVIDGAGDVFVFACAGPPARETQGDVAESVRCQPYTWLDFDGLDADKQGAAELRDLSASLDLVAPRPGAMRSLWSAADREVLCWYDAGGHGLTAELRRDEQHLLVHLIPGDPALEYATLCAAGWIFGGVGTRLRPVRTGGQGPRNHA